MYIDIWLFFIQLSIRSLYLSVKLEMLINVSNFFSLTNINVSSNVYCQRTQIGRIISKRLKLDVKKTKNYVIVGYKTQLCLQGISAFLTKKGEAPWEGGCPEPSLSEKRCDVTYLWEIEFCYYCSRISFSLEYCKNSWSKCGILNCS